MTALEVYEVPGILGLPASIYVFSTKIYTVLHSVSTIPAYGEANALAIIYIFIAIAATWLYARGISLDDTTVGRELKALGFAKISARPRHDARNELAVDDVKKAFPPSWKRSATSSRPMPAWNSGGRTKRGSVRKTKSRGAGRHREPGRPGRPGINARSQPISLAPSVPSAASARPSFRPAATPSPCNGI